MILSGCMIQLGSDPHGCRPPWLTLRVPLATVFGRAVCGKTARTVRRGGTNGRMLLS
jgi:hypothetical protein